MDLSLCGRVGCGEPTVCILLIAASEQRAWLVDLGHRAAVDGVPLCVAHADRISVPMGWQLTEERSPAPKKRRRRTTKRKTAPAGPATEQPASEAPVTPDSETGGEPPPDAETEGAGRPPTADTTAEPLLSVVEADTDQGELWPSPAKKDMETDETTPMLKRAFRLADDS